LSIVINSINLKLTAVVQGNDNHIGGRVTHLDEKLLAAYFVMARVHWVLALSRLKVECAKPWLLMCGAGLSSLPVRDAFERPDPTTFTRPGD
jgi:hypothetical protein